MAEDLTELRAEGWKRLLAAARRNLERTGGALDRSIGLTSPTDAERRLVIGITGSYRPQTVKRLTIELATLDAALRQRYDTGLHDTLVMFGGPSAQALGPCRATVLGKGRCGRCTASPTT